MHSPTTRIRFLSAAMGLGAASLPSTAPLLEAQPSNGPAARPAAPSTTLPGTPSVTQPSTIAGPPQLTTKREREHTYRVVMDTDQFLRALNPGEFKPNVLEIERDGRFKYSALYKQPASKGDRGVLLPGISPAERKDLVREINARGFAVVTRDESIDPVPRPFVEMRDIFFYGFIILVCSATIYATVKLTRRRKVSDSSEEWSERPSERFGDVGGNFHAVEEFSALMKNIRRYKNGESIKLERGLLLMGEPGVGKTLLIRATAGEADCPFLLVSCGGITSSSYVGDWTASIIEEVERGRKLCRAETKRLRALPGATGKEQGVVIIALDEFDTIGRKRSPDPRNALDQEHNNMVNTLLAEFDPVDQTRNAGLVFIGATNLGAALDPAFTRPGRFNKTLTLELPTNPERLDILEKVAKREKLQFANKSDLVTVAQLTPGKSGDHLRALLVEAREIATLEGGTSISLLNLMESLQRQAFGKVSKDRLSPEKQKLVVAHELGHGIAALMFNIWPVVMSAVPRGITPGRVIPDANCLFDPPLSFAELIKQAGVLIGGRAGELVSAGKLGASLGVEADVEQMTEIASEALRYGMLDGRFEVDVENLGLDDQRRIDEFIRIAQRKVIEAIELIGKERLARLTDDLMTLAKDGKELVGGEAVAFLRNRIPQDELEKLAKAGRDLLSEMTTRFKD